MGQADQHQHGLSPASLLWYPTLPGEHSSAIPLIHLLAAIPPILALHSLDASP